MAKDKMKIGIIGFGRIAIAHANAAIELKDQLELVAIADINAGRSRQAAEQFGIKRIYDDHRELLKEDEVEAVIVCLPNYLHHSVCIDAAHAGKHILVEKPMSMNAKEAYDMVEAAHKNQVALMVGQSRRFSDGIKAIREKIVNDMGRPFRIDINFLVNFSEPPTDWWKNSEKAGGLVILLQGSHSVDTVLWLLNKMPSTAFSMSHSRNNLWEGEDEADVILGFNSGELATVHLSLNTYPYLHETIIVGKKGTMRLYEFPLEEAFGFAYRLDINGRILLDAKQVPSLYTVQLKEFADAIHEDRTPISSGDEVRKTMLVLDAIRKSDREGKVIHLNSAE